MSDFTYLDTPEALDRAGQSWAGETRLAVDTEFVRTRTFYPKLGLVQVASDEGIFLLDPLAIDDLESLARVLRDPQITKIFHSPSEDFEVLYHLFGEFPQGVFDTQIAAALAGHGPSLGYGALVAELLDVDLPKGQTRTDWLRRPLSEKQLHYAALDVAHLPVLHEKLERQLAELGRTHWAEEEFARLGDADRFLPEPEEAYLRLKQLRGLSRRQTAVLRELAAWREREARRRDLPRNFVVHQNTLKQIAQKMPPSLDQLGKLKGVDRREIRRHGGKMLEIVRGVRELPEGELPPGPTSKTDLSKHRERFDTLRGEVADLARELGLAPELLATRRQIEELLQRALVGEGPPEELQGWRWSLLEARLDPLLDPAA